jgi:hypothetical protein
MGEHRRRDLAWMPVRLAAPGIGILARGPGRSRR